MLLKFKIVSLALFIGFGTYKAGWAGAMAMAFLWIFLAWLFQDRTLVHNVRVVEDLTQNNDLVFVRAEQGKPGSSSDDVA
jgi:hypothetical protein